MGPGWFSRATYQFSECKGEIDEDEAWALIQGADRGRALLSCSWGGEGMETVSENTGLVFHHAYTVMRAVEVNNFKLLQCRNPWGNSTEWGCVNPDDCEWCDQSPM